MVLSYDTWPLLVLKKGVQVDIFNQQPVPLGNMKGTLFWSEAHSMIHTPSIIKPYIAGERGQDIIVPWIRDIDYLCGTCISHQVFLCSFELLLTVLMEFTCDGRLWPTSLEAQHHKHPHMKRIWINLSRFYYVDCVNPQMHIEEVNIIIINS